MPGETDVNVDIVVPNQTRYLGLIGNIAEQIARELVDYRGDRDTLGYHMNLVLTEAMVNAIEHATPGETGKTVRVWIHIEDEELCIRVYDQGQGFDLESVPMPDFDAPGEHGRGIFFIRALMDTVTYRRTENGNVLEMRKKLA
ncbi:MULTISPECIES: ATP-binding protein [Methylococcus]|jgi:serine/threonine-protein kinase RsbW|uniref:Anti-sigma B factor n=2 Tax=Methylococcus capsulatus TaxID=414 RepID=Q607S0_METCA|nr:ATP-binding protein [Methylococcus capsulatus]AAU92088.1 anti-sigma B factor [Methylococcus capsulatus str. Bath]QXP87654.1 ATP-binding protein [Methylococcus capsulatus]QXP90993.1 ATP-binding protein [Methylococcus capsulatus]QXP92607.1 ATP-binding protein [Methylococcus capsulatus]UQN12670.1 ATP-binding protein [Methylococcus capsulatus]